MGYYDPSQLRLADSPVAHRPILLCADFHFLLDYMITIHERYRQTDEHMVSCSISTNATRYTARRKK